MNSINVYHQFFFVRFFFTQVKYTQSRASWTHVNHFKTYTLMHDTVQKCSKVIIRSVLRRKRNPTHRKIVPNHFFFQRKRKWKQKKSRFKCIWSLNALSERHHFFLTHMTHSNIFWVYWHHSFGLALFGLCESEPYSYTNSIVHYWEELATIS